MATIFDVAKFIIAKQKSVTAMKLQKLVYYSQAWSLVWDEKPLFKSRFEAWANGPVAPELYKKHRGLFKLNVRNFPYGDSSKLSREQKDTIRGVLDFYGDKTAQWLSDLAHMEEPWIKARKGLKDGERGNKEIRLADMEEYYSGIK